MACLRTFRFLRRFAVAEREMMTLSSAGAGLLGLVGGEGKEGEEAEVRRMRR